MKSEEYAKKYLRKFETKALTPERVKSVIEELLRELHGEMFRTFYDQNISLANYDQWGRAVAIIKNYNEKSNAIFRKMNMPHGIDLFKKQITIDNQLLRMLWDKPREEIDRLAKIRKEIVKPYSRLEWGSDDA